MKINKDVISGLNPCEDRLNNYLKFYGDKTFTKAQFMGLKNITHDDKLWVALRLMNRKQIILATADIAESVLHLFEYKYPNDKRPREAIELAKKGKIFHAYASAPAAYAAYVAARSAAIYTSAPAAYAAADAAYAAYAAAYAAYAAAYAAADAAASAAADAAAASAKAKVESRDQEKLIRKIILNYWK
jgi:hypothetical protein